MKNKIIIVILLLTSFFTGNSYSQFYQEWATRYNGTGNNNDEALSIAIDNTGNVYVTGYTTVEALNENYATVKYNSQGVPQWSQVYNGPSTGTSYDDAYAIAVDPLGDVYVTGFSRGNGSGYDIATIKYNSSGYSNGCNDTMEAIMETMEPLLSLLTMGAMCLLPEKQKVFRIIWITTP